MTPNVMSESQSTNPYSARKYVRTRANLAVLILALSLDAPGSVAAQDLHYRVLQKIDLDSAIADFLSVDPVRRHLYGAGDNVIDIDKLEVVGELPAHTGHGFAIAPELGRGLGRRGVLFDLTTFAPIAKLSLGGDASAYDRLTKRGFFFEDSTTVVDLATGTVVGHVALHGKPESGESDGAGRVLVNIASADSLAVIDTRTLQVTERWPIPGCHTPTGLALDTANHRVFVSCDAKLVVLNSDNGQFVASVPVTARGDQIAFDHRLRLVFIPNGSGTMAIIHQKSPDEYTLAQQVTTDQAGPAVVLDESTHRLFLFRQNGKALTVIVVGERNR
jgi:DNA-binding beta-propeller fold protein YncE